MTTTGGTAAFINLESKITKEAWVDWALKVAPKIDMDKVLLLDARLGQESCDLFGKLLASNAFDLVVFDSIGAMGTDAELEVGGKKQAYGQSGMVTQMVKQAAGFARQTNTVALLLNQIRDESVNIGPKLITLEKAPGGHAKAHFATMRLHLKPRKTGTTVKIDGDKIDPGFRVEAKFVKNKVGNPRRTAGWNFWNYEVDGNEYGFDRVQDVLDTSLQHRLIEQSGGWFKHPDFPNGKLQGKAAVKAYILENPDSIEDFRRKIVISAFNGVEVGASSEGDQEILDVESDVVANEAGDE